MATDWDKREVSSYIAEICLELKRLAAGVDLAELAEAIEEVRRAAQAISQIEPES